MIRNKIYFCIFILSLIINIKIISQEIDLSFLIPKDMDIIYCIGASNEKDSILSMDTANAKARVGLANFVRDKLKDIIKNILKNFNPVTDIPEYEISIKKISEEAYNLVLYNSIDDKNFFDKKNNVYYVRVIFNIKILRENFEKIVRNNADCLIKLKMNRPLQEFIIKLKEINSKDFYEQNILIIK